MSITTKQMYEELMAAPLPEDIAEILRSELTERGMEIPDEKKLRWMAIHMAFGGVAPWVGHAE